MAANATVHARVDAAVKQQAAAALERMGLTVSSAVNMFLTRVAVEQASPFKVRVPNAATREAIAEAEEILATRRTRFRTAEELMDRVETAGE